MSIRAPNVQGASNLPQHFCASLGDKYAVNTGVFAKYLLAKMVQKGAAKRCNLDIRRSILVLFRPKPSMPLRHRPRYLAFFA